MLFVLLSARIKFGIITVSHYVASVFGEFVLMSVRRRVGSVFLNVSMFYLLLSTCASECYWISKVHLVGSSVTLAST